MMSVVCQTHPLTKYTPMIIPSVVSLRSSQQPTDSGGDCVPVHNLLPPPDEGVIRISELHPQCIEWNKKNDKWLKNYKPHPYEIMQCAMTTTNVVVPDAMNEQQNRVFAYLRQSPEQAAKKVYNYLHRRYRQGRINQEQFKLNTEAFDRLEAKVSHTSCDKDFRRNRFDIEIHDYHVKSSCIQSDTFKCKSKSQMLPNNYELKVKRSKI